MATKGLWFRNVDLHVHTPGSECFLNKEVTPEQIVQQAIAAGMDAIAITDHNTGSWVDRVKNAAAGTALTVFPGVEITVQPGVHVLAIFQETKQGENITDLLAELGINADNRGKSEAVVTRYGIQEVVSRIKQFGALPILAHIDTVKGAWTELRNSGQTFFKLWNSREFVAVEIVGDTFPTELLDDRFTYRPAYYWSSDNPHPQSPTKHSEQGIGARYSRFKLETPITLIGLLHCFQDPDVRIKPGTRNLTTISHPIIQRISITGGFLNGLEMDFTPNLNAIIGGRGTGKSSLLEILRHAFTLTPNSEANCEQSKSILSYVFPATAKIRVDFRMADGCGYYLERNGEQLPKVYRSGENVLVEVKPSDLLPIQVYGQKEIYEISKRPDFQLRLLDNYIAEDIKALIEEENEILHQLSENATAILVLEENIQSLPEILGQLAGVQEELRRMETQGFLERIQRKQLFDQELRLLDKAQERFSQLQDGLAQFINQPWQLIEELENTTDQLPNREFIHQVAQAMRQIQTNLDTHIRSIQSEIEVTWQAMDPRWKIWRQDQEEEETAYQALLNEYKGVINTDRYASLQQRKTDLDYKKRQLDAQQKEVHELQEYRITLLNKLRSVRRRKYELRRDKALELSKKLRGSVRITIYPGGYREPLKECLHSLFEGLNVRQQYRDRLATAEMEVPEREADHPVQYQGKEVFLVSRIPNYYDPIALSEALRMEQKRADEDPSPLEEIFKIDADGTRRNMASLEAKKLFELETFEVPDLPVIELHVAKGDVGYRKLDELSVGQRCTALLSLILLESPAPLIIDQPEDDLDNQFIFNQIVNTLRTEKERRQFIVATHNANIPVSGDAELIAVLESDQSKGWVSVDNIGSIDSEPIKQAVERILEGGEVAFNIRKEKYGI